MSEKNIDRAYHNRSADIGWNTTISSPKMHILTLEHLIEHIKAKPNAIVLDVGVGSGYLSTCLALALGKEGKVYSVDHIDAICDFAK